MSLYTSILLLFFTTLIGFTEGFRINKITPRKPLALYRSLVLNSLVECQLGDFDKDVIEKSMATPVVVDFYADWCGPCKLMSPIFKALSEEVTDVEFVKVNTDLHEDKIDGFNIQGLPLFGVFLKGKMVASHSGALSKEPLKSFVAKAISSEGAKV